MSVAEPARSDGKADESDDVLRAKYHDYCSAQLADLLLYLTPDDIYLLAQKATRDRGDLGELSYARTVAIATEWLARRVALPPFEVWVEDYRAHPERYEEYFMGLWESEVRPAREAGH